MPSFSVESEIDAKVKVGLIYSVLKMVALPPEFQKLRIKNKKISMRTRTLTGKKASVVL